MVLLLIAVLVAGLLSWVVSRSNDLPAQVHTLFNVAYVVTCVVLTVRVLELVGIKVL